MSGVWRSTGAKFYAGKIGESPWNNDLHHKHTLENENNYYHLLATKALKLNRDRNPFNLTLDEVVNDETAAKKFAVRQTNGIQPRCSHRSEPDTSRRLDKTVALMRSTNSMLAGAIPRLKQQVQSTQERVARLERLRVQGPSSPTGAGEGSYDATLPVAVEAARRDTYVPSQKSSWRSRGRRAHTAGSVRSGMSSVLGEAKDALGKATNVLQARPQTAKTTKTILSHRNRHGWSSQLRGGDIVKHAGRGIPQRAGHDIEVDHTTGEVRKRVVKARPATALGVRQPSCRRAPGYKAPHEDYSSSSPPGDGTQDPSPYGY